MSTRDGRASRPDNAEEKQPLYARLLRLEHIQPGPWWCFLFLEGSLALAGVLVLADWVNLWGLVVVPLAVAGAVKLNDVVTGALPPTVAPSARSDAKPDGTGASDSVADVPTASNGANPSAKTGRRGRSARQSRTNSTSHKRDKGGGRRRTRARSASTPTEDES